MLRHIIKKDVASVTTAGEKGLRLRRVSARFFYVSMVTYLIGFAFIAGRIG